MKIRKATLDDLDKLNIIYTNARLFMKEHGNPNQWYIRNYPGIDDIKKMINTNNLYVIEENNEIYFSFLFYVGIEPTYNYIKGSWLNDKEYGVIHAVASAFNKKGMLKMCLDFCSKYTNNLRIDTHADNIVMQNALTKNGFLKCGIIYLLSGDERIAYQRDLDL